MKSCLQIRIDTEIKEQFRRVAEKQNPGLPKNQVMSAVVRGLIIEYIGRHEERGMNMGAMVYTVTFRGNLDIDGLENLRCPKCGSPLEQLDYDEAEQLFYIGCSAGQEHHEFRIKAGTYQMLSDGDTDFVE